ncbi:MAG: signal peptidase II [Candidatus Peribacteraceae bacterium]|nr:signal peptidase II [Candidatus Peribacteraceae bacterium]MDD5741810.1 signal peptidase II [Candidatus Peribacteraceae bacterium]
MGPVFLIAVLSAGVSVIAAVAADSLLLQRISILGSFVGLQHALNPGVAFGISFAPLLQISLIAVALLAVAWMARKTKGTVERVAYGLILGGGIANIIDRLPDGLVTDYFQVGTFPVFNVADSCITVGVLMLFWEMLIVRRRKL